MPHEAERAWLVSRDLSAFDVSIGDNGTEVALGHCSLPKGLFLTRIVVIRRLESNGVECSSVD